MARPTALAAVLAAVLLTGCSGSGWPWSDAPTGHAVSSLSGPSVPRAVAGEHYPGTAVRTDGTVQLADNGCWFLLAEDPAAMIAWPAGAELGEDGRHVRLDDGTQVPAGAQVTGTMIRVPTDRMPGGPDGYWASIAGFCEAGQVAVLEDLTVAGTAP